MEIDLDQLREDFVALAAKHGLSQEKLMLRWRDILYGVPVKDDLRDYENLTIGQLATLYLIYNGHSLKSPNRREREIEVHRTRREVSDEELMALLDGLDLNALRTHAGRFIPRAEFLLIMHSRKLMLKELIAGIRKYGF